MKQLIALSLLVVGLLAVVPVFAANACCGEGKPCCKEGAPCCQK